jgi:hypothetical protein
MPCLPGASYLLIRVSRLGDDARRLVSLAYCTYTVCHSWTCSSPKQVSFNEQETSQSSVILQNYTIVRAPGNLYHGRLQMPVVEYVVSCSCSDLELASEFDDSPTQGAWSQNITVAHRERLVSAFASRLLRN